MSDQLVLIQNARLSFPHLVEPQERVDPTTGKKRISYNADFILEPNDPSFARFMQRVAAIAGEKWKEHANQVLALIQAERKNRCYGSGNEKIDKKTFQPYGGYKDMVYITAGRDQPPQMIQADGQPIAPDNTMGYQQLARKMYAGCRVNAALKPWAQENQHGRGIRCDLVAIQFARDDAPFGEGAVDASGLFGAAQGGVTPGATPPVMPAAPFPGVAGLPPFMQ